MSGMSQKINVHVCRHSVASRRNIVKPGHGSPLDEGLQEGSLKKKSGIMPVKNTPSGKCVWLAHQFENSDPAGQTGAVRGVTDRADDR